MKKRAVEVTEVANIINEKLRKGAFLTSKSGDKVNSMVIGWGHIGRVWERPVCIAYVRTSRYTSELIDSNPEFTVNVPVNGFKKEAFALCGSKSGRDMDKISMAGLSLVEPEVISVPAIKEFPLTLECRVVTFDEDERGGARVVGEIVNMSADESILDDEGNIDLGKLQPVIFDSAKAEYRVVGEKVGKAWDAGKRM